MKFCKPLTVVFTTSMLLFADASFAQDMSTPAPAATAPVPSAMPSPNTADMQTPKGEVTVNSAPASAPAMGQAPSFEQLSGGGKTISEKQALAYPPLANDFVHADGNRDGTVSKAEYQRWLKQL